VQKKAKAHSQGGCLIMRTLWLVVALYCFVPDSALAQETHAPGSGTEKLGSVRFPISCSPDLQKSFERGVALLHSFWEDKAREQFESVARQDPHCDMAYWGIAISYWTQIAAWPSDDDVKAARQALAKTGHSASPRERDYIQAMADFYGTSGQPDFPTKAQGYNQLLTVCKGASSDRPELVQARNATADRTGKKEQKNAPVSRPVEPPSLGPVVEIPKVGGLHHLYTRKAA
jgi:hypothetical protein